MIRIPFSTQQEAIVKGAMQAILVINAKGGSGKSTLATNLASYFATKGHKTAIMDYDPHGSSLQWLKDRPKHHPTIHGANASLSKKIGHIRSIAMAFPLDTEYLIIDAPPGVEGLMLQEMVQKCDFILTPVVPYAIDFHTTAEFLRELILVGGIRYKNIKNGIVANKVRNTLPVYEPLQQFLDSLNLPFLTKLSDADNYILAAGQGLGVFEMDERDTIKERNELQPIIEWIMGH